MFEYTRREADQGPWEPAALGREGSFEVPLGWSDESSEAHFFLDVPDFEAVRQKWLNTRMPLDMLLRVEALHRQFAGLHATGKFTLVDLPLNHQHAALWRHAERDAWNVVLKGHAHRGLSPAPATDYILGELEWLACNAETRPSLTIMLLGHQGVYAEPLEKLAYQGRHSIILLGVVGFFERALYELSYRDEVQLVDVEYDLHLSRLHRCTEEMNL